MKNINLNNLFQHHKKLTNKVSEEIPYARVLRDWRISTLTFAVILIVLSLLAWQVYLSREIGGGYLNVENTSSDLLVKIVDEKRLEATISRMKERESAFLKIKSDRTKLGDPGR
jgi:hypothetical protein